LGIYGSDFCKWTSIMGDVKEEFRKIFDEYK
jgi:hypothetical protein